METVADAVPAIAPKRSPRTQIGQLQKFLPLPPMPHHTIWFDAGPISFAVEGRTISDDNGKVGERSASIHIFSADHSTEYVRFDCFAGFPHYHYIQPDKLQNIAWGYDEVANGPMVPWALTAIRERLPVLLRNAEQFDLADRIEHEGFDLCVLNHIQQAIDTWEPRAEVEMIKESREWYKQWKAIHPQFDTAPD